MKYSLSTILATVVIVLGIILATVFTIDESDRGIIVRLGDLQKDSAGKVIILQPGLHWKFPIIDRLTVFDARLKMTEIPSERIVTKEKEVLMVDVFVEWRIIDFALFYNTTQGIVEGINARDRAEQLLRQNVKGVLHAEFGQRTIQNVISGDRRDLMEKLVRGTDENLRTYGMEVIDIRVNRLEYPPEVNDKVFARMRSEREQVAVRFRANGESKAAIMRADADRQAKILIAEAEKESAMVKGEGDAKTVKIYADSYNQSPEFFEFYRSLQAYEDTFKDKQDTLFVLKPEGEFFKYFGSKPFKGRQE